MYSKYEYYWFTRLTDISWHIFTGVGVYIFMVLVECLLYASSRSNKEIGKPSISSAGIWPFTVYLEEPSRRDTRKKEA